MGEDIREVGVSRQCRRMAEGALQACAALSGTEVSWKEASHQVWDPGELAPSQSLGWALGQSYSLLVASLCLRKTVLLVQNT